VRSNVIPMISKFQSGSVRTGTSEKLRQNVDVGSASAIFVRLSAIRMIFASCTNDSDDCGGKRMF